MGSTRFAGAVRRQTCFAVAAVFAISLATTALPVSAQEESYAFGGDEGGTTGASSSTEDPLRIMGFLGGGVGFRVLANLDPLFRHSFLTPAYLDVGGALYLPGRELRHGVGLALSTNLSQDEGTSGQRIGTQWVITPSYSLLLPLWRLMDDVDRDEVQLQVRVGIPLVIGQGLGNRNRVDFTFGGELALAVHYKFLAGFGIYLEVQGTMVGGIEDTLHPFVSVDAGFLFDYEVLP